MSRKVRPVPFDSAGSKARQPAIARFINMVMQSAKKPVAEKLSMARWMLSREKRPSSHELVEKALGMSRAASK